MPRKDGGRWQRLLADEDVKRWYDNLARGSVATADNYLRTLGRFLHHWQLDPREYARLEAKRRNDLLADFITEQLDVGRAPSYVEVTKKVVVSWLDWNGKRLGRRIKVEGTSRRPTQKDAYIPMQEELRRVLNVADARARTAIALMAFSGLRPQVFGSYKGEYGLKLGDFAEGKIDGGRLSFDPIPTRIVIPDYLSKIGKPYFTFLGPEGCEYLTAHFRERAEMGEEITEESPVITPRKVDKPFMRTINIGDLMRRPMRKAGLQLPPYIWRSYFSSRAMLAESKGLTRGWREHFMGHSGGISAVYALHKQLPPDTVEAMREAYGKALEFLETVPRISADSPRDDILETLLMIVGYRSEEIDAMDFDNMTKEELAELVHQAPSRILPNGGDPRQRILPIEDLPRALKEGWLFKASLPGDQVIVEWDSG